MSKQYVERALTRRDLLRLSTAGAAVVGARVAFPGMASAAAPAVKMDLYSEALQAWCDGLLAHQIVDIHNPALHGALLCPACAMVHGRCGDAVYPLMRVARTTGDAKYLRAAEMVYEWAEQQVSRADGSWVNDVTLSSWKGITVFHTISLGEALHHHGTLLDAATRRRWIARLARAVKFLDGFISIETGNINYPVTACYAFALCAEVLEEPKYVERGRKLAHEALEYFTANELIYGEGHPLKEASAKGCHPVDLGYNVEESLPALALYATLTGDEVVTEKAVAGLRAHMEFMLPDGAWDNSWGTRNYKWSWWGSRTSDGCHPAYVLLSDHEPKFREVARRNLELMAACTHEGLLYGGPDYFAHGDLPCIHHTFAHAKALATVLDRGGKLIAGARVSLPRDEAKGLRSFPEIHTHLASVGEWRATATDYDWEYVEHVQTGGGSGGGGHASGGALSLLFHRKIGPVLVASMTEYQMIEISNQQTFRDAPHMTLTPRIEYAGEKTYTSLTDREAVLTASESAGEIVFDARGRMLTAGNVAMPGGVRYHLVYRLTASGVDIVASGSGAGLKLIVPVVARSDERVDVRNAKTVGIARNKGGLIVRTDAEQGFDAVPKERTFNLVPGFECVPLTVTMKSGQEVRVRIEAA